MIKMEEKKTMNEQEFLLRLIALQKGDENE